MASLDLLPSHLTTKSIWGSAGATGIGSIPRPRGRNVALEIFEPDKKLSISGAPGNAERAGPERRPIVLFRLFVGERHNGIVARSSQCRIDGAKGCAEKSQNDGRENPAR